MSLKAPDAPIVAIVKDPYGGTVTNPTLPVFKLPIPAPTNWEDELRQEFGGAINQELDKRKEEQSLSATLFLIAVIVVLVNLFVAEWKNPGTIGSWISNKSSDYSLIDVLPDSHNSNEPFNYEQAYKALAARVDVMEQDKVSKKDFDEARRRLRLIATVLDENTAISNKMLSNQQKAKEYVFINKDWKITRMPSNIPINDAAREFLEQYLEN